MSAALSVREMYLMAAAAAGAKVQTYVARSAACHPRDAELLEPLIVHFARDAWGSALDALKWREH